MEHTLYLFSSVRTYKRTGEAVVRLRRVPFPMLCLVVRGKAEVLLDGAVYEAEPYRLFFLHPGMSVDAAVLSDELECQIVFMRAVTVSRHRGAWNLSGGDGAGPPEHMPQGCIPIGEERLLPERFQRLAQSAMERSGLRDPNLQLQELLHVIARDAAAQSEVRTGNEAIDRSIAYMHKQYERKLSRDTLAQIARLSPNSFCRSFKKATGVSPTDYVNQIRLQHAKQRLSSGGSVKEVSASVGFDSEYYFSRLFKRHSGIPPALYIKRYQLRVASASRFGYHDNLAAIGVEPVAAIDCHPYPGMSDAEHRRLCSVQLEELKRSKPELIVADFSHQALYDTFKSIAPTVLMKFHMDWRVTLLKLGEMFDRDSEARRTVRQLEERTAKVRKMLAPAFRDEGVTYMQVIHSQFRVQGTANHPLNDLLYAELGFNPGSGVPRGAMREHFTPEQFPDLDADHLFIEKFSSHPEIEETFSQIQRQRRWQSIRAVRNGQARFIPNWLTMSWTPQGRHRIIDELVSVF